MAKIAYILLCHKDPEAIIAQARRLTAAGDFVAIHFDGRAKSTHYTKIRRDLAENPSVTFAKRRLKCGWGEWSLVAATLEAVRAAVEAFPRASHFYMLSGDCAAIKSSRYAHDFLDQRDVDYIESFDFFDSNWIKTGIKEERLIYRHFFNERARKWLFYKSLELQQKFNLKRPIPADLQVMIGSQWWCLRRRTIETLLDFVDTRKDVLRFFKTTWIPDETFFQTLVAHLVPSAEIERRTLTFLMFTDYGMPVTFYNDHYDLLLSQDFLFARKISPGAKELKERLGRLYSDDDAVFTITGEGLKLFRFLTARGRVGQRFAPRLWEDNATLGRDRQLLIITCKKWHVGKRFIQKAKEVTGISGVEYLFDEEATALPDLGGIGSSLAKRSRHRRAVLHLLFDVMQTRRLMILLDPSNFELMRDVQSDHARFGVLEIECGFTDDYLIGHASRVGLSGKATPEVAVRRLLPVLRNEFRHETRQIRAAGFDQYGRVSEGASAEENTAALASFLEIPEDKAKTIVTMDHLFSD